MKKMTLSSWIATLLICVIMAIALIMGLSGCLTAPKIQPTTCVINSTDKECWTDKSLGTGMSFPAMDGWFCMDQIDMQNVLQHLNECKSVVP